MRAATRAMTLAALTLGLATLLAAQAPAGTADPVDPIGSYDFIATLGIEMRTGTIEIHPTEDGFEGEVRLQGESDAAVIDDVVVTGQRVEIQAFVNGSLPVTIAMDFTGPDVFTGTIAVPDDSIVIDGSRRTE